MLGWFKRKKASAPDPEQVAPENSTESVQPAVPDSSPRNVEETDNSEDAVAKSQPQQEDTTTDSPVDANQQTQEPPPGSTSVLKKLSDRLSRTRTSFTHRIDEIVLGRKEIDGDLFDELEEVLVTADLGIRTTQELLEQARRTVKRDALSDPAAVKEIVKQQLKAYITATESPAELQIPDDTPFVIMVVGVNGVGKTTTIGKIARKFVNSGQSVLLVAADTFRAAATSQLQIWGERNNVRVIAQHEGADPSAVVFDGMAVAKAKGYNVVLVDTAGRLHTKVNLMEELKKIKRVMAKQLDEAPHEILLVIDATTGQNGISQAKQFNEAVGVTGIALTKLDGTAKGGIIANITNEMKLPIRFIGVGEQVDDLRDFDADEYLAALFES